MRWACPPARRRELTPWRAEAPLDHLLRYPLMSAMFGRRARRFGLGMEIPSGPLAFCVAPRAGPASDPWNGPFLFAAGTGVTGWSFGVPARPRPPRKKQRIILCVTQGARHPRPGASATPAMLMTDDAGTYLVNTRDITPRAGATPSSMAIKDDAETHCRRLPAHRRSSCRTRASICPRRRRTCWNQTCGWPTRPGSHPLHAHWGRCSRTVLLALDGDGDAGNGQRHRGRRGR